MTREISVPGLFFKVMQSSGSASSVVPSAGVRFEKPHVLNLRFQYKNPKDWAWIACAHESITLISESIISSNFSNF